MRNRYSLILGLAAAIAVLVGVAADLLWLRLLAKPVIILAMIAWVWPYKSRYQQWLIIGLVFSILGGLLLEVPGLFLAGLIAFLLAHLAYMGAYFKDTCSWALGRAIPFFLYGAAAYALLWPGLKGMALPVGIYILAISTMMWRAAARLGSRGTPTRGEWLALIGAILFALSDTLIGVVAFLNPLAWLTYPILILYWVGQAGIAYSALEIPERG